VTVLIIWSVVWCGKKCNKVDTNECFMINFDAGHFTGSRQAMKKQIEK
jgi:hypothetical protein